jgi:peptidyl-Lys metalloendopeptidase
MRMRNGRTRALVLGCLAILGAACASSRGDTGVKEDNPTAPALTCELKAQSRVQAGSPVSVELRLTNRAAQPLYVLGWRTPFEGLFGNDWQVTLDGAEIPYVGPMAKRGDPEADDYVTIAPGAVADAEVEVSLAYDMKAPGRYKVALRGPLMDVTTAQAEVPRPLAQHKAMPLQCPVLEIEVTP